MLANKFKNDYLEEYRKLLRKDILSTCLKRQELVQKYAWAIPNSKAIKLISEYGPIIEIGAGRGYWASLIANYAEIVCFDKLTPPHFYANNSEKQYHPIQIGDASTLIEYPDYTLFLCWPPYNNFLAADCLKKYSGEYFIYVGESEGGCNAEEEFFNILDKNYRSIMRVDIPQFDIVHDYLRIFKRK